MEHLVISQVSRHGYLAVFLLMVLESACIPIPSEAIMLFGGALAGGLVIAGVHPSLNVVGVALAGAAGNLIGSYIAYAVGRAGGRPLVERWGRYILLRHHDLDRAEAFFARRGEVAVLVGRVLPVVRTFISLPAGVARMPAGRFGAYTLAGSLPWTFGLAFAGEALASHWKAVSSGFTPVSIVIAVIAVAVIAWWALRRLRARNAGPETSGVKHASGSEPGASQPASSEASGPLGSAQPAGSAGSAGASGPSGPAPSQVPGAQDPASRGSGSRGSGVGANSAGAGTGRPSGPPPRAGGGRQAGGPAGNDSVE